TPRRMAAWSWIQRCSWSSTRCGRTRCVCKVGTPLRIPTASREVDMTGEMTLSISSGAMLVMLGAYHGINPGMGWLFAVALGMQERRRAAVCRALLPLGMGHALAVGAAVAIAVLAGAVIPIRHLRWPVAGVLL